LLSLPGFPLDVSLAGVNLPSCVSSTASLCIRISRRLPQGRTHAMVRTSIFSTQLATCVLDYYCKAIFVFKALWPSGLRRQNQDLIHPIWSSRARVRISLVSLQFCLRNPRGLAAIESGSLPRVDRLARRVGPSSPTAFTTIYSLRICGLALGNAVGLRTTGLRIWKSCTLPQIAHRLAF
jgi:hypothetical protein